MSAISSPGVSAAPRHSGKPLALRAFYPAAAAIVLVLTFLGFHHFYLEGRSYPGREIPPPIRTLIIAHGVAMAAWLILFAAQPLLVASGRLRVHMTVGKIGAALAVLVFGLGIALAIQSTRYSPPDMVIWTLQPRPFMAIPFLSVFVFAGFVGVGIWKRKKPAIHRPMMLLGTVGAAAAGISRIDTLNDLYTGTGWERAFGPFLFAGVLAVVLLAVRCALTRTLDRAFAIGTGVLVISFLLIMQIARTSAWEQFAGMLAG